MRDTELDWIDEHILFELQREGRATITEISTPLPVSANTVRNRVRALEETGIIKGYTADIDYVETGLPFHYLFTCSAPIAERSRLVEAAFDVNGVLTVRELMTGHRNVIIEVIGEDQDDITRIAQTLDDIGLEMVDENLIKSAESRPLEFWNTEDGQGSDERDGES